VALLLLPALQLSGCVEDEFSEGAKSERVKTAEHALSEQGYDELTETQRLGLSRKPWEDPATMMPPPSQEEVQALYGTRTAPARTQKHDDMKAGFEVAWGAERSKLVAAGLAADAIRQHRVEFKERYFQEVN
jgi:hypothetical protein